jgi:hypothetical protein
MNVVPMDDAPIQGQKFMCVCLVSPNNEHNKAPVYAFKVKYVGETIDECRQMAKKWMDLGDEPFDILVGPVGKWVPHLDDFNQIKNVEYQQEQLTEFIMGQKKRDEEAKTMFEERLKQATTSKSLDTRDAVRLRYEISGLETQLSVVTKQIKELETKLRSLPEETQEESRETFTEIVNGDTRLDLD